MNIDSYRVLPQTTSLGTLYRVDGNRNNAVDDSDDTLMQRSGDSWQPASSLPEGGRDRFSTEHSYALWNDREVSHREGWPWNRKTVVDRPIDGKVDADEITGLGFHRLGSGGLRVGDNGNAFQVGSELADKGNGLSLDIHSIAFPPLRIIGEGDIARLHSYRADNSNWQIASK